MGNSDDMVQQIIGEYTEKIVPSIIMYTEEQIADFKNKSPLSFDKTFILGEMFVTASTYRHTAVTRVSTGLRPVMLGTVFIHGHSTFDGYQPSMTKLSACLRNTDKTNLILGSDDERALRNAIKFAK